MQYSADAMVIRERKKVVSELCHSLFSPNSDLAPATAASQAGGPHCISEERDRRACPF